MDKKYLEELQKIEDLENLVEELWSKIECDCDKEEKCPWCMKYGALVKELLDQ